MIQKSYDGKNALYLIPTPIGNMEDITVRALNILKMVDIVLAEDTRVTKELLNKFDIKKKVIHSDDHTENKIKENVVEYLNIGLNIGLVTDRGTPIISDPGYGIVKYVIENNHSVISLPGATAFVPALTMSGLNPSPFLFYGFLNSKESKRNKELELLKNYKFSIIFYEAPHRIKECLNSILNIFGNRNIALCREISKKYEEVRRGTVSSLIEEIDSIKGEIVLVVEGNKTIENYDSLTVMEHIMLYLDDGLSEKEAIKKVSVERDVPKSIIYKEYHTKRGNL